MNPCNHEPKFKNGMCLSCWMFHNEGQVKMLSGAIEGWRSENESLRAALAASEAKVAEQGKEIAKLRRCYACGEDMNSERSQCPECWQAMESKLSEARKRIEELEKGVGG